MRTDHAPLTDANRAFDYDIGADANVFAENGLR
jgi:hypothetical protein